LTALCFTCKFSLTYVGQARGEILTSEELLTVLTAVANLQRLRVVAALAAGRVHVSELARRLGMSRPLLYMHLDRLEKAGLVAGHLELSEDGKAMKYFELAPFELRISPAVIVDALAEGAAAGSPEVGNEGDTMDGDRRILAPAAGAPVGRGRHGRLPHARRAGGGQPGGTAR
jgi:DNA-binding transcriptional ArsR family regulator